MQTQIELRQIDGQQFIVTRQGKKEFIRTVAEQIAIEEREIANCMASIADAQTAAQESQRALEDALLSGESAATHRTNLAAANEHINGFSNDAGEARDAIRAINDLVIQQAVEVIRQADADRLNALSQPYAEILKENQ
jgi:hypothetical protein